MNHRPDPVEAGRQLLELQLSFMKGAMTFMAGSRDYALRMQRDVDSIVHAFAMVPDATDRLIRTSALLTDKRGKEAPPRARAPAKPASARRPARRDRAEHAR